MGVEVITEPNIIIDWKWYHCTFHEYITFDDIPCEIYLEDDSCCARGVFVKWYYWDQCTMGGLFCFYDPLITFVLKEIVGPYDSEADCLADNPGTGYLPHFYTQNLAYVIAEKYNFFPKSESKFEMEIPDVGNAWSFHADNKNLLKLHVRFNQVTIAEEL